MMQLAWLIPVFPLIGFLVISLGQKVLPKSVTGIFASLMVLASFILSAGIFLQHGDESETVFVFDWIKSGSLSIPFSFLIDSVSITMLLIVTGVGFLIHVYSIGYMKEDEGYSRFFS
ncbi:MAG: NADH-quinone oxidoreductase subunit L, partial [Bacteroidia bacterium]|nr:NADH-quinone oxidoreductase subunit L [Bacteroidia bacterium]